MYTFLEGVKFSTESTFPVRLHNETRRGAPVVVWLIFWRVGCPPCWVEMPHLEGVYGDLKNRGICFQDHQRIVGTSAVPLNYIIDGKGKIVEDWYGFDKKEAHKIFDRLKGME